MPHELSLSYRGDKLRCLTFGASSLGHSSLRQGDARGSSSSMLQNNTIIDASPVHSRVFGTLSDAVFRVTDVFDLLTFILSPLHQSHAGPLGLCDNLGVALLPVNQRVSL